MGNNSICVEDTKMADKLFMLRISRLTSFNTSSYIRADDELEGTCDG